MKEKPLRVAITAGDPAGIGPEIALRALNSFSDRSIIPVLICRAEILTSLYPGLVKGFKIINSVDDLNSLQAGAACIFNEENNLPLPLPGKGTPDTGRESLSYIDRALEMWKGGNADAIVTGPVSKGLIEKSGTRFTGHTEYMAESIGEDEPRMMMFSDNYRVLLATTHIPVSRVADAVDADLLCRVIADGYRAMLSIDGGDVRIAVAGMDPHCGDDGAIGDFDRMITARAVARMKDEGVPVEGPFAADTVFMKDKWQAFNLVIVHYHDQGLIPFKMLAFDRGVNVTLGLTLTRTSVDHGTAFDLAGTGKASYSSMVEAIKVASLLERNRRCS